MIWKNYQNKSFLLLMSFFLLHNEVRLSHLEHFEINRKYAILETSLGYFSILRDRHLMNKLQIDNSVK